jgi:hypothetical protein
VLALLAAGGASAYALGTIWLRPGHCKKVHGTKVCARKVKPVTTTVSRTSTVTSTVTVAPSPIGQTFSGNRDSTLAPRTIPVNGVVVHWTAQPDHSSPQVCAPNARQTRPETTGFCGVRRDK